MNIGEELSQIKYCKTIDEVIAFLKKYNLEFDHCYPGDDYVYTCDNTSHPLTYIVANYWDNDDVWINFTFSLKGIEAVN